MIFFLKGKAELEELNEAGELRKILAEYPVSCALSYLC